MYTIPNQILSASIFGSIHLGRRTMKKTMTSEKAKDYLLIAVVQSQDAENAEDALCKEEFSVTRFPSVGAFLGRKNATLMIGLPKTKRNKAIFDIRCLH